MRLPMAQTNFMSEYASATWLYVEMKDRSNPEFPRINQRAWKSVMVITVDDGKCLRR